MFPVFYLSGCVTVPAREPGLVSYYIQGTTYVGLISLCQLRNIDWDYDVFTRKITLRRGSDRINLMVGSTIAVVNGAKYDLGAPVETHKGMVVIPARFKRKVIDSLFSRYVLKDELVCVEQIKKIIIDPGHGGKDPGAIGKTGLMEKDVNLDIAKRIRKLLMQQGMEVIMTRETDEFVSLAERSHIANSKDADIFISIHANANRVSRINGFEIYCLSEKIDDSSRAFSAAKNADPDIKDASFFRPTLEIKAILWDLIFTQNRAASIELAHYICHLVNDNLDIKVSGLKDAGFQVLKTTRMPAILIEIGYLSNNYEERMLNNSFYRQQIAEAIALGIESYCKKYPIMQAER